MREKYSNSVVIKSVNRKAIREAVESYVANLKRSHPEVERVLWFGSWLDGLPTPGSDVDLCLLVSSSNQRPRDRISLYLPSQFPTGIDLFVYTLKEFECLRETSPQWHAAIDSGREFNLRDHSS
jgi:predicted nucleotidyltransferase